jgi:hypothetical protein
MWVRGADGGAEASQTTTAILTEIAILTKETLTKETLTKETLTKETLTKETLTKETLTKETLTKESDLSPRCGGVEDGTGPRQETWPA